MNTVVKLAFYGSVLVVSKLYLAKATERMATKIIENQYRKQHPFDIDEMGPEIVRREQP